jgi:hypothetical protein
MNEGIEIYYRLYIITSGLKTKLTSKSRVIIIQIWEPERIGKTFEEELKSWPMFWLMDTVEVASS